MNFYGKEIRRIRSVCWSNKEQLDLVIGTKRYIDRNYDNEINLDSLAYIRYVSKYHLLRLFKQYYGITPRQYLIGLRLKKAREFLSGGMGVTECCYAVGFSSLSSFTHLFKGKTGITPSEFRNQQFSTNA